MSNPEAIEIVLVEDNDSDAELTLRALKEKHLTNQISRFADGQEILDYLFPHEPTPETAASRTPKLILLDLKLPLISGLEVLKRIKSDPRTKRIPVVVLTSSTEDSDINECYHLGVNSYIVKPVQFDNFIEAVQKLELYWMLLNRFPTR